MSSGSAMSISSPGHLEMRLGSASPLFDAPSSAGPNETVRVENRSSAKNTQVEEVTDTGLIQGVRDGDSGALRLLFRRYARIVRSIALRVVGNSAEADDIVQEVFLFVFRKAALFDPRKGSVRSWLGQIAYHRAIDHRRRLASQGFYTGLELQEDLLNPEDASVKTVFYEHTLESVLGRELLRRIEESLSPDQHRVIRLHFLNGNSMDEIATMLGQTVGNVRNHYYRALERMRKLVFGATGQERRTDRSVCGLGTRDEPR